MRGFLRPDLVDPQKVLEHLLAMASNLIGVGTFSRRSTAPPPQVRYGWALVA